MSRSVDFSKLTLQDALDLAILVEDEAKERYEELADQMDTHRTPQAAAFFRFMVTNEAKHGEQLLQRRRVLFGDTPAKVSRDMLWDVEAPDYDEARAFMSARDAMLVALAAETKAHNYFVMALEHVADREVQSLFEELRDDEKVHEDLVRKELAKLPPDPGVNPDDWVDEPVSQ
jgi:rubrerythrin